MSRNIALFLFILGSTLFVVNTAMLFGVRRVEMSKSMNSPLAVNMPDEDGSGKEEVNDFVNNDLFDKDVLNILLLGIDRRSRSEYVYRTDIMIMLSINSNTNKVTLVSIPRDLWYHGQRVNAAFIINGFDDLSNGFYEITGLKPKKYILTDFKDFSWIVDAMGGVPVNVERDFTDTHYPVDETLEYQTITFTQGQEILTGDRALIYARSRKGTNGEGSDWARMRRQHLILKGMLTAVAQPKSVFNPMNVESAYRLVTEGKMDTNLSVEDAKFLWDMYKDKDKYTIESLFLDGTYLYSPPMEDYGGAWVLVSSDPEYTDFKKELRAKLYNEPIEEDSVTVDDTAEVTSDY